MKTSRKNKILLSKIAFCLVISNFLFVNISKATVNSATFDSEVKSFSGNSTPSYGDINWKAGATGNALWTSSLLPGSLGNFVDLKIDSKGDIYGLSSTAGVNKYSNGTWTPVGSASFSFTTSSKIVIDQADNLYVSDTGNNKIQKYSNGAWISIATPFTGPTAIAIDSAGNLYASNPNNSAIQKYDSSANSWSVFVSFNSGSTVSTTAGTSDMLFDSANNFYWTDRYSSSVYLHKRTSGGVYSFITHSSNGLYPHVLMDKVGNFYELDSAYVKRLDGSTWINILASNYLNGDFDANGNLYLANGSQIQKWISGASIQMRVRTGVDGPLYSRDGYFWYPGDSCWDDAEYNCINNDPNWPGIEIAETGGVSWRANFSDTCNVNNNSSIKTNASGNPNLCVNDGDPYVQYEAILNTDTGTNVPQIGNVTISTRATYPTSFVKLISNVFDTGNANSSVQKITWSGANDGGTAGQGTIGFQIRTSADNATWGSWCGPATCGTTNDVNSFGSDYYTDKAGATAINLTQTGSNGNRYIQYATFLKSTDGAAAPILTGVTLQYAYNIPPAISSVGYTQNSDGTVSVPYSLSETYDDFGNIAHGTSSSPIKALLFYQSDNGITAPALTNSQTGLITLNNPNNAPIPSQGSMLIDNELISFDSAGATGNQRNITARAVVFTSSYPTTANSHSANTPVYFEATKKTDGSQLIHTINTLTATGTAGAQATINNSFAWDPKNEPYISLAGNKLSNMQFKVVANDADPSGVNNIGAGSVGSAQSLDLQAPSISSVTTSQANGFYAQSVTIPLAVTFSENINFDATGGKTISLTLNSGTCSIASSVTNSNSAPCSYIVGSSDNTPAGQYLKVTSISTSGAIKDQFGNQQTDFAIPANQNIDQNGSKQIIIDNVLPTLSAGSDQTRKSSFTQTATQADDNSGIDATSYQWTKVSGPGIITFGSANALSTTVSANADGNYFLQFAAKDKAGNQATSTMSLTWDTANPTTADNTDANWHSADVTITLTCSDATSGCDKTYYTTDGSTPTTSSTQGNSVTLTTDGNYTLKYFSVDKAGNTEGVKTAANLVKIDKTAPTTSDNADGSWHNSSFTVNFGCSDASGSGCDKTYYTTDGSTPTTASNQGTPVVLSADQSYTLKYFSVDKVGNTEGVKSSSNQVKIDTIPATGSVTSSSTGTDNGTKYTNTASVVITNDIIDINGSGVSQMSFSNDNATWSAPESYAANKNWTLANGDGTKTIYAKFTDNAGNVYTTTDHVTLDTTAPTVSSAATSTADGFYNQEKSINVTVNFSEPITSTSDLVVTFNSGGVCTIGQLTSPTNTASCSYTVGQTDNADNLKITGITGEIKDIAQNAFNNNVSGSSPVALGTSNIVIDTRKPALQNFTTTTSANTLETAYGTGTEINVTANFDEPIVSGSNMDVILENSANPQVVVHLDSISGNSISGSFTVQGPRKGYDTENQAIRQIQNMSVTDRADNTQTDLAMPSDNTLGKNIAIDTGTPVLQSFTAVKKGTNNSTGYFKAGDQLTITANYSKPLKAASHLTIHFNTNNGSEGSQDVNLATVNSNKVSGTYTVASDENANNLKVASIVSQSAIDLKNNELATTSNTSLADYDNANALLEPPIEAINNIADGIQIDTQNPINGSIVINQGQANESLTKDNAVKLNLNVDESHPAQMQFSNNGTVWCAPVAYATTYDNWDLLNTGCGGQSPVNAQTEETAYARFIDQAGNISDSVQDTITYDNTKPVITSITTDKDSGIYGPHAIINLTATYSEPLKAGSSLTIALDNNITVDLSSTTDGQTLTGVYTVGNTGSAEDSGKLKVKDTLINQNAVDLAGNAQNSTTRTGDNLDRDKEIIIDTTAPADSNIVIDRANEEGKVTIKLAPTDTNPDQMVADVQLLGSKDATCNFADSNSQKNIAIDSNPKLVTFDDSSVSVQKGCVKYKDYAGNISNVLTVTTPESPANFAYTDISNVNVTPQFLGAFLTWQNPTYLGTSNTLKEIKVLDCKSADSSDCVPQADGSNNTTVNTINYAEAPENYFVYNSREANSKYCYRVYFANTNSDTSAYSKTYCAIGGQGSTVAGTKVEISNPVNTTISNITKTSATVSFQTFDSGHDNVPLPTKAIVSLYSDPNLNTKVKDFNDVDEFKVLHSISLDGLEASTTYYLKIVATDFTGSEKTLAYALTGTNDLMFTTLGQLSKILNISNPPAILSDTKAEITFDTDQDANCFIQYGTKSAVDLENKTIDDKVYDPAWALEAKGEYTKKHVIHLTSLFSATPYFYRIGCTDNASEQNMITVYSFTEKTLKDGTASEGKFQTLDKQMSEGDFAGRLDGSAPVISSVSTPSITGENATIAWSTNEVANSLVVYEAENSTFSMMAGDSIVNTSKTNFSTAHSVTIANLIPATKYLFTVISYDSAGNIGQSNQTSFVTTEPSSLSSVKVVSTALGQATVTWETSSPTSSLVEYGLSASYGHTKQDSAKTKDHSIVLEDLTPGQTYHFRVKGEDDFKNIFASTDSTFQPKAPPKISDYKVDQITEHGAMISFTTNVPTDSLVTYTDSDNADNSGFQGRPEIATKHEVQLKNLASGVKFSIKIKVTDEDGNVTEQNFSSFATAKDEVPPKIDRVKTDSALTQSDKVQAIISWTTDEMATGTIVYREGKSGEEKTAEINTAPTFSHVGVITSFKPGTVYYFNVKSTDEAGNIQKSSDYALLTPKQRQNIIQIIVGNFTDIFGWAKF